MRRFLVKQKFRLGGERFDIKDEMGNVAYQVEGSFLIFPKHLPSMMFQITKRSVRFVKKS